MANPVSPVIHGPGWLRALKIAVALVLGTPVTLVWLPYMVPFAIFVPLSVARDVLAGRFTPADLGLAAVALSGTLGLVGFWLWVFDHPGRSVRLQRIVGALWLIGAATLGAYAWVVPNLHPVVTGVIAGLAGVVALTGLAMCLRPRVPHSRIPSGGAS